MKTVKYAIVFCLVFLNQVKGDDDDTEVADNVENYIWNIFNGENGGYEPPNNCKGEFMTCETRNASVVYTRWGRSDCTPDTSDLVYSGYIGGGHYTHGGGGTNALCLPETPEYDNGLIASGSLRSLIYGAELQTSDYSPWAGFHDNDPVCSVCLAQGRSTSLMIPAKRTCPQGWTKEYEGLLMGSYRTHAGHDYLCVDLNPEVRPGSSPNHDGFLLYPAVGDCGYSLACPPYVDNAELSCVVCTW
ncbi:short-chain collagen C4-like [Antedon mediterranea]|uniref:short-chain collagen C4-like n=1 Tax=Antedon mediterranea TaxID=105859 RepID=UPI003AF4DC88